METICEAAAFLRQHNDYLIMTHRRPDGDAIGSAVALCLGLRDLGKNAEIFPNTQFSDLYAPLLGGLLGSGDPAGKTVISVDLADEKLLPYNAPGMAGKMVFAVDHHPSNTDYAPQSLVIPQAAACGEIILDILNELQVALSQKIADALYVALSTDTGCFRFSNVTGDTFRAAAACTDAGADLAHWNRRLFLTKSMGLLKLEAYMAKNTQLFAHGTVAILPLPHAVLEQCGVEEDELTNLANFCLGIAGVEIGATIQEVRDGAKISLRAYDPWDASFICSLLGGGGHAGAAGATVPGTLQDGKTALLDALRCSGAEV